MLAFEDLVNHITGLVYEMTEHSYFATEMNAKLSELLFVCLEYHSGNISEKKYLKLREPIKENIFQQLNVDNKYIRLSQKEV